MKVLTAAQMREIDRRTIEMGVPGIIPMENAGHPSSEIIRARMEAVYRLYRIAR